MIPSRSGSWSPRHFLNQLPPDASYIARGVECSRSPDSSSSLISSSRFFESPRLTAVGGTLLEPKARLTRRVSSRAAPTPPLRSRAAPHPEAPSPPTHRARHVTCVACDARACVHVLTTYRRTGYIAYGTRRSHYRSPRGAYRLSPPPMPGKICNHPCHV